MSDADDDADAEVIVITVSSLLQQPPWQVRLHEVTHECSQSNIANERMRI